MANPWKGDVQFGPKHTLRLDFNAICEAENDLGESLLHLISTGQMGFKTIRAVSFRGLQALQPDLTINDVGTIIGDIGFKIAATTVIDVIKHEIMGEGDEGNALKG